MSLLRNILVAAMVIGASSGAIAEPGSRAMVSAEEVTTGTLAVPVSVSASPLQTDVQIMAAAPPLTALYMYSITSSNCGTEYMTSQSQTSTVCNHGGAVLRAAIVEIGYGSKPMAWMNSTLLATSKNYQTVPVCVVNSRYTWPCPAGYTIVGFLRNYNLDGYQSGVFKYQNTSSNSPWNTISKQIRVL